MRGGCGPVKTANNGQFISHDVLNTKNFSTNLNREVSCCCAAVDRWKDRSIIDENFNGGRINHILRQRRTSLSGSSSHRQRELTAGGCPEHGQFLHFITNQPATGITDELQVFGNDMRYVGVVESSLAFQLV